MLNNTNINLDFDQLTLLIIKIQKQLIQLQ